MPADLPLSDSRIRFHGLDGLRAIAALAVVVHHTWLYDAHSLEPFRLGPIAVRLFFVLSGFLITPLVLDVAERARSAGKSRAAAYGAFVARRSLRIVPQAYLFLIVAWAGGLTTLAHGESWWYFAYLANWQLVRDGWPWGLAHLWSLSLEEQFYVLWPVAVLLWPRRRLPALAVVTIAIAIIGRMVLLHHGALLAAFVLPWARCDSFAVGALVSLPKYRRPAWLGGLGLALVILPLHPSILEFGLVLISASVVLWAADPVSALSKVLAAKWLAALGGVSYGIYLWHPLVKLPLGDQALSLPQSALVAAATIAIAFAFDLGIDRPLATLRNRFGCFQRELMLGQSIRARRADPAHS